MSFKLLRLASNGLLENGRRHSADSQLFREKVKRKETERDIYICICIFEVQKGCCCVAVAIADNY